MAKKEQNKEKSTNKKVGSLIEKQEKVKPWPKPKPKKEKK